MEAIKIKHFRRDYTTLARRLLAVNGYSKEHSFNPHNVRAFVIHDEFSAVIVAIGSHINEALDNAVDNDLLDSYATEHDDENACHLGNASEPFDLSYIGVLDVVAQYE